MEGIGYLLTNEHTDFLFFMYIIIGIGFFPVMVIIYIIAICKELYQQFRYNQKINQLVKDYKKEGGNLAS